jgi:protein tyrosine phosphatase
MIIMLTNLEEYNRVKCAQYWPQAGDLNYLATPNLIINVGFCTEKRYSDYIVRELTLTVKSSKKGVEQVNYVSNKKRIKSRSGSHNPESEILVSEN